MAESQHEPPEDLMALFREIELETTKATSFVVFEPNNEETWAEVRRVVANVLNQFWEQGSLKGSTGDEAFFVKVGPETMTQQDIDNGKLIIVVGIAPVRPAEFVILQIGQLTQKI